MAGSVWNSNSWHWEEKNYNKWGESYIRSKILSFRIEKDGTVIYPDQIELKGNTSVSIRKGKQISSFEYEIKFEWLTKKETNKRESRGTVEIMDFCNCSLEDNDYEIKIERDMDDAESMEAYTLLKKEGVPQIRELLKDFVSDLLLHDSSESKKELRIKEQEDKKLQELQNEGKDEKTKTSPVKIITTNEIDDKKKKDGSIWNINNYHWEEKCLTSWAQKELKQLMENNPIELSNNISVKFFDAIIEGEASANIRKQKKILIYDLKINSEWIGHKKNKHNEIELEIKGHITVSEIISDFKSHDETSYKYNFIFDNISNETQFISDVIKKEAPTEINKIIESFILKMKDK